MTAERSRAPDERRVAEMFDRVAPRYDAVNTLLSLGLDRWWRRRTARAVDAPVGTWVLDLGSGTGALSAELATRYRVVALDASEAMLRRSAARSGPRVREVLASAFRLPLADGSVGAVASAFVLRNLQDLPGAFAELARVTRRGAPLSVVDIVPPAGRLRRRAFEAYFARAAPALGAAVGRRDAYRYLVRSLEHLPPPGAVAALLSVAGFDGVRHASLFPGPVTLWTARRA